MSAFEQRTKRLFLFIVFGIAWGCAALALAVPQTPVLYLAIFAAASPLFAAYTLHLSNYTDSFFTHVFLSGKPNVWWIVAVFVPLFFCFVLLSSFMLIAPALMTNPFIWLLVFLAALLQEIGWRGFFQKEFTRLPFWQSSLIVGAIIACWHIPVILVFFQGSDWHVLLLAAYFLLASAPLSFLTATSKSSIAAALMQTGLFMVFWLSVPYLQAVIVVFALLLMLNGLVMLANAVYPSLYRNAFVVK
ncbi:hypothetical protein CAY60_013020 [Shouchella clausii]|jgi:hypothetical protein|uniref:CPBP family intramembrane metalloprotease n=1 Tax=Shouchella clausii (strain KSM-K16) TaxID=66692 RepID=Q5WJ93_SHOC1|nr:MULTISPECIES: CPBP family glutamic-type intramembrane protease [Shouchella]MCM3311751.1 hypothetical protein [Psychrobacillus sp. MER TA 17]ALA51793.1 Abortive infection protein [Shouchella clausii]KKI87232.1 hypothetical protein WZ76_06705 [Shouchella clausii]MBU3232172.1 hypothetical protein [Shouchella clausii]MBU3264462.1 hypothetical protein [Shouchella clausii]